MANKESIDKIDEQIKELQEESEHYNKMLDENDMEEINKRLEDDEEHTKEFNEDDFEEIEEDEDTKEFEQPEEEEEEYVPKHKKEIEEKPVENKEEKKEETKEEKPKNNKKKIIIISLIIAIILALLIIIIVVINMNKKEAIEAEKEDTYSTSEMKKILKNYGNSIENVISINLNNNKELLSFKDADELVDFPNKVKCKTTEVYEDGKIYLDNCTIDGHKTKAKYGTKQEPKEEVAEVAEGSFYVYEKDNKAILETPSDEEKDKYQKYLVTTNTTPTNITLLNNYSSKLVFYTDDHGNIQIKNYKTDKYAVPINEVKAILPIKIDSNYYDTTYIGISDGNNWGIYNLNTGLTVVKMIYTTLEPNLSMGTSGPPQYISVLTETNIAAQDTNNNKGVINYKTGDILVPFDTNGMQKSGEYLWKYQYTYNDKTHESEYTNKAIYDFDGNKYLDKKYDDLYGIVSGKYILVKDNKDIKMVLIDGKELYNYKEIPNLGSINYFIGYNQNPLFQFNKKDKTGTTYENECIEVSYDNKTKKGSYKDYQCGGIAKPILYLYPTETTNVKITFDHPDLLKTTYPKYNKEWNVTVKTDGTMTDTNGRTYYALYWDEKQKNKVSFKEGFYVTSNNAIKFLEEKLFEIGLTEREANEFIMYWLPILENNKKSLVYFELTKEREKYNKINIDPQPDSLLRLTIHIKKVNKETKIKEEKLTQFNRTGFTAVEWGGVTY